MELLYCFTAEHYLVYRLFAIDVDRQSDCYLSVTDRSKPSADSTTNTNSTAVPVLPITTAIKRTEEFH